MEEEKSTRRTRKTKLEYYQEMWKLESKAKLLSFEPEEDCTDNKNKNNKKRYSMVLDSTIFHPQGGGQPSDTGLITIIGSSSCPPSGFCFNFLVQHVRSKDGTVFHYGVIEDDDKDATFKLEEGVEVTLRVDEERRKLNSRLHSAGHLLDACLQNVGLGHFEPGKGYHFPDGPFVEYKGTVPQTELQNKQKELELEVNALISKGGKVTAAILPYDEACKLCGGSLPEYIPKDSTPRIVKLGDSPGCPCGGTHVSDISEIISLKVSQIRTKKGMTKVFYNVGS